MLEVKLGENEFIPLCDLLKKVGLCESGGHAKAVIAEGLVKVDNEVELRKRCKIKETQVVDFEGQQVTVVK